MAIIHEMNIQYEPARKFRYFLNFPEEFSIKTLVVKSDQLDKFIDDNIDTFGEIDTEDDYCIKFENLSVVFYFFYLK